MKIRVFLLMEIVKKIASYFWDIPIEKTSSSLNPHLEVVWSRGIKMLHSKNANYSFGSLHQVFEKAFQEITDEIKNSDEVLILGFGAGSILDILDKKYAYKGRVTGIDYDPKIFELYKKHFETDIQLKAQLIISDAETFIATNTQIFDLIFVDLFQDLEPDTLLAKKEFASKLKACISTGGTVIINTTSENGISTEAQMQLMMNLSSHFKSVFTHKYLDINTVFFAK